MLISLSTHLTRHTLHLTFVRLCCCCGHPLMNDLISPTWGWKFSFKNNKSLHKYKKTRKKSKNKDKYYRHQEAKQAKALTMSAD